MKIETEMNSGSKWRRSLMALAVLSAPVVSIAGFSATASAGTIPNYVVTWDCTDDFDVEINVQINTDANSKIGIYIRPDSADPWGNNRDFRVIGNVDYDELSPDPFSFAEVGEPLAPITAGAYDVKIVDGNDKGNATAVYETTITVAGCVPITFPEEVDDFVTIYCSGETAEILVKLPQRDPPTAKGPKYDVYVYEDEAKGFSDEATNLDQSGSAVFETGEGTFEIEIYLAGDKDAVYSNTIEVDCTIPRNPGGGYNFNLPKLTTPKLPTTGSDSSTSLLVIAPMMVLLGAGLIAARRRLATV